MVTVLKLNEEDEEDKEDKKVGGCSTSATNENIDTTA